MKDKRLAALKTRLAKDKSLTPRDRKEIIDFWSVFYT